MATAALTLAVGLGVNAVAFSVVNALLFKVSDTRSMPGAGRIATTPGGDEGGNGSLAEFERFSDATRGAVTMAAEARSSMAWRHDGTTETAWVLLVSSNYFSMVQGAGHRRPPSCRAGSRRSAVDRQSANGSGGRSCNHNRSPGSRFA